MQENAPRKTSHYETRLKHLNNIVMLASDAESYIRRDDKDPSRPKNGVIIFLDTEHIHRLDDMIEMCSQYKDLDIKLCNHPGCDKKAKFGTPYSSRDPVACVEHRETKHCHMRCDISSCQKRCIVKADSTYLCIGHLCSKIIIDQKKYSKVSDPEVTMNICPLCCKQTKYGIHTKKTMCSALSRIFTDLLGIETKDVVNRRCGQFISSKSCGKRALYTHTGTNSLYCTMCAKKCDADIWDNITYIGPNACIVCKKKQGVKKDTNGGYICNGCIDTYKKTKENTILVHNTRNCIHGTNCTSRSYYGTQKGKPVACTFHKTSEMFNVVHPRCPMCEVITGYKYSTMIYPPHIQCRSCRNTKDDLTIPRFKEIVLLKSFVLAIRKIYPNALCIENMVATSDVDIHKKYRPDLIVTVDDEHRVVIEIDENGHNDRHPCNELERLRYIAQLKSGTNAKTSVVRLNPDNTSPPIFHKIPTKRDSVLYNETYESVLIYDIDPWLSKIKKVPMLDFCVDKDALDAHVEETVREFLWARSQNTSVVTYIGYSEDSVHLPPRDAFIEERGVDIPVKRYSLCTIVL